MNLNRSRRRGLSLVEVCCIMALIAVIGTLLTLLLRETLKVEQIQAQGFDKLLLDNVLADLFRADVAQAENAPPQWEQYTADATTLILQMKKDEHLVYRWQQGELLRLRYDPQAQSERQVPVGGDRRVEFVHATGDAKLVRLRLSPAREVSGQTLEIAAALGGDVR